MINKKIQKLQCVYLYIEQQKNSINVQFSDKLLSTSHSCEHQVNKVVSVRYNFFF